MKPRIRRSVPRPAVVALTAGIAIFAVPAAANAAVTSTFANGTLTVTSDDASDTITLGVAGANITAPGVNNVPNDGSVNLVVNGGGGNDNINVSAPSFAGTPALNGDDGDDTITGTPRTDAIDGGNGNDRITAGKNTVATDPETIHGGAGNDVIIWNNGDGDDINEGDAGVDESLIV